MPWSAITPGSFQRAIGRMNSSIGDPGYLINREHWAINSIASFTLTGSLVKEDLPFLILKAWKDLRFIYLSMNIYIVDD